MYSALHSIPYTLYISTYLHACLQADRDADTQANTTKHTHGYCDGLIPLKMPEHASPKLPHGHHIPKRMRRS